MADKYNKLEPKVPKEVIYSIAGFIAIVLVLFLILIPTNKEKIYNAYSTSATADFTKDHPFVEVSYNKLLDLIESDEFVFVFIGTPSSSTSTGYIGDFQKYYEQYNVSEYVDQIYYYDVTDQADNFLLLQDTYDDISSITTQLVLFINGEITAKFVTNGTTDAQLIARAARDFFEEAVADIEAA